MSPEQLVEARVLFRVDDDNDALFALVQSKVAPDWTAVMHKPNYATDVRVTSFDFQPQVGQQLRFRLLANPTKASSTQRKGTRHAVTPTGDVEASSAQPKEKRDRGQRVGLYREWERLDWLRRQGENHGFALELKKHQITRENADGTTERFTRELPLVRLVDLNDGRRFPIKNQTNQFSAALFDGDLTVTNAELFARAIENGIGKAKGFGFGLLSVAPATT